MKKILKYTAIFLATVITLVVVGVVTGIIKLGGSSLSHTAISATESAAIANTMATQTMTFDEATDLFAPSPPNRESLDPDQQAYLIALESVAAADFAGAEPLLKALTTSDDTLVRESARKSLAEMYWVQQKFGELVSWVESDSTVLTDSIIDAEDWPMAQGFNTFPPEEYQIPEAPVVLPMSTIISGQAQIEVTINGVKKTFLLDTGADMSVVTTDILEECGITVARQFSAQAKTSTDLTVEVLPGLIDELQVGAITVKNHPVLVIGGEDLEFSLLGITFIDIDGIIGLPFFMNLAARMDFANGQITFSRPSTETTPPRNLFWLETPLVRLYSPEGVPLLFFLDTGANNSSVSSRLIERLSIEGAREANALRGGAGGFETKPTLEIDSLQILLDTIMLTYGTIQTGSDRAHTDLTKVDGVLGIDIVDGGELYLDFTGGRIELKPAANRK